MRWIPGTIVGLLLVAAAAGQASTIELDAPSGPSDAGLAFVAGRLPGAGAVDLVLAVDTSASTDEHLAGARLPAPPGLRARLRGWWRGRPAGRAAPGTLLGEALDLAGRLVDRFDARSTRIGLVRFAGDLDAARADAHTLVPLTHDFARVRAALAVLAEEGASGTTNPAAGLHRALIEHLGTASARSTPRADAQRVIVLFGDGAGPAWRALKPALARARSAGIRVDAVVVGEEAERPLSPAFVAVSHTGGRVLRAGFAGAADSGVAHLRYGRVHAVRLRNRTIDGEAVDAALSPDGGFASLLALARGENRVEVRAWIGDSEIVREFSILTEGETREARLSPPQLAARRRLLEERLRTLRAKRVRPAGESRRSVRISSEDEPIPASPSDR